MPQLPQRDALDEVRPGVFVAPTSTSIFAPRSEGRFDDVEGQVDGSMDAPLGDGSDDRPFSTATYRGKKKLRTGQRDIAR